MPGVTGGFDNPGFNVTLTSSGPTMYLKWDSDGSIVYKGWKVRDTLIFMFKFVQSSKFNSLVYHYEGELMGMGNKKML